MKYFASAVLAAAALIAMPAAAQAAAQSADNSGFHVAAIAGYDDAGATIDEDAVGYDVDSDRESLGGFLYGATIGYDHDFGSGFAGLEVEVNDSTGSETTPVDLYVDGFGDLVGDAELNVGTEFYVGARGGMDVSDTVRAYLKAGYVMGSAELDGEGTFDGQSGTLNGDIDLDGWRIGAGAEANFTDAFFGRLEYRYSKLNVGDVEAEGITIDLSDEGDVLDIDRHQVVVGVGFRF